MNTSYKLLRIIAFCCYRPPPSSSAPPTSTNPLYARRLSCKRKEAFFFLSHVAHLDSRRFQCRRQGFSSSFLPPGSTLDYTHTHKYTRLHTHTCTVLSSLQDLAGLDYSPHPPDSSSQLLQTLAIPPFWLRRPQTASLACHRHLPSDWSSPPQPPTPSPTPLGTSRHIG